MTRKHPKQKQKLPKAEFAIFNTALSVLAHLEQEDTEFDLAIEDLFQLCCEKEENNSKIAGILIRSFVSKFRKKSLKCYGEEGFELSVISTSLADEALQKKYLLHDDQFNYTNQRQLINITTKIINHFRLEELAKLFKQTYFSEVDLVQVVKYCDPGHKTDKANSPTTRYAYLLDVKRRPQTKLDFLMSSNKRFKITLGFHLVPKNKMNPRLPLVRSEINEKTPAEHKYHIGEEEQLITAGEIVLTEKILKRKNIKHASPTPGPLFLGPFPVVSSINKDAQTTENINDLIAKGITSVLSIEAKNVAERIYNNEMKALPSNWIERGVTIGIIQCPDLHAMRIFHTLLAAQYLFSEVLACLPSIKDAEYTDLIDTLMKQRFDMLDENPKINKQSNLRIIYDDVISLFPHKKVNDEVKYFHAFMDQYKSEEPIEGISSVHEGRVLVHCKAGMSRSATALLSMYIFFVDVILRWHAKDFVKDDADEIFFGAIIKAIYRPSKNPFADVSNIVRLFSKNYRPISLLDAQIVVLAQLIQYKRSMLATEEFDYHARTSQENHHKNSIIGQ